MRVGLPHLVAAALVMVVALLVVNSIDVEAKRYIVTDSWSAPDGSDPDVNKWVVEEDVYQDIVQVSDGRLMTWSAYAGHAYCTMARPFSNDNITLTVEFSVAQVADRSFDIALITGGVVEWHRLLTVKYEGGVWGWERQWEGDVQKLHSTTTTLVIDRWYVAELDIFSGNASFSVRERDGGSTVWHFENLTLEPIGARNLVTFGVDMYMPGSSAKTYWDNLTLVDPVASPNKQPSWSNVPSLFAVEDIHKFHDFQRYIVDDQEPWELTLASQSEYVMGIDIFEVDFLFPNNVTNVDVILVVFDGYVSIPHTVHFDVTPVNDPPEEALPDLLSAVEGITSTIDLEGFIWDIDNDPSDIKLIMYSPYIIVDGLKLEVHFPEGMTEYNIDMGINDGNATITTSLYFLITPLDNPPVLGPIDDMMVTEDVPTDLDLTPMVSDPDDPIDTLAITVSTEHAMVDGLIITFLYPEGGFTDLVIVRVSDGFGADQRSFNVRVLAMNDPPVIAEDIPPMPVYEDETTVISLSDWITDEDHAPAQLVLKSEDPNIDTIDGLSFSVLYTDGGFRDIIHFNVSDGEHEAGGSVDIEVLEVNDLPRITGVGDQEAPYYFRLPSNADRFFQIHAVDGDDRNLRFSIDATWRGFWVSGTQLVIGSDRSDSGDHVCFLNVHDNRGGHHRVKITAHVTPRSELPIDLFILTPGNRSKHDPGDLLTFTVNVIDPDGYIHGTTTVTWTSDIMGDLATLDLAHGGNLTTSELVEGRHIIYVTVTDGTITMRQWIIVDVGEVETSSTMDTSDPICTIGFLLIIILVMGVVIGSFVARAGKNVEPEPSPLRRKPLPGPRPAAPRYELVEQVRLDRRKRLAKTRDAERTEAARARREEEAREARIRAQEEAEDRRKATMESRFVAPGEAKTLAKEEAVKVHTVRPPGTPSPPSRGPGRALPTAEEMGTMRTAITESLGKVPGGLPSSLSLYDEATIANRIVKGRKMWSEDGRLLAFVQGEWYYAHPGDKDFMRMYDGP